MTSYGSYGSATDKLRVGGEADRAEAADFQSVYDQSLHLTTDATLSSPFHSHARTRTRRIGQTGNGVASVASVADRRLEGLARAYHERIAICLADGIPEDEAQRTAEAGADLVGAELCRRLALTASAPQPHITAVATINTPIGWKDAA